MTTTIRRGTREQIAERRQRVTELAAQGLTTPQIAERLGVHLDVVQDDRALLGCPQPRPVSRYADVVRMHAEGHSDATIADRLGMSRRTVAAHRRRARLTANHAETAAERRAAERSFLLAEFAWLTEGGVLPEIAAERLGMTVDGIRKWQRAAE